MGSFAGGRLVGWRNWNGENLIARWRHVVVALVVGVACLIAVAGRASSEEEAWNRFRGQIVLSDILLAPSFGSDQVMITSLNRMRRSVVGGVAGFWRLHFVAFLDRAPEGDLLRVAARDVTSAENRRDAREGTLEPVRVFEVTTQPAQKILQMSDLVLTEGMGFARGHAYEVSVEKNLKTGGKADVYARGVITLR